jgi:hypothetical protein
MPNKVRIVQRKDGSIFTWTPVLDAMPEMHPGWLTVHDDGRREIQLDRAVVRDLDVSTLSQRERSLIEENAKLRQMLAVAGGVVAPVAHAMPEPGGPQEYPIPPMPDAVADLTVVPPEMEEPIAFQPEPKRMNREQLEGMTRTEIGNQIRAFDRAAKIPGRMGKPELVELCLTVQGQPEE